MRQFRRSEKMREQFHVQGLTKLNFNACIYGDGQPVTLRFADAVGEILSRSQFPETETTPFQVLHLAAPLLFRRDQLQRRSPQMRKPPPFPVGGLVTLFRS
jgi:hypothetical protein